MSYVKECIGDQMNSAVVYRTMQTKGANKMMPGSEEQVEMCMSLFNTEIINYYKMKKNGYMITKDFSWNVEDLNKKSGLKAEKQSSASKSSRDKIRSPKASRVKSPGNSRESSPHK